jgi:hypothetical protein
MGGLGVFALLVLLILAAAAVVIAVILGSLPGKIAANRNHPHASAVRMCGWMGLLTLGLLWPIAFVWAYTGPLRVAVTEDTRTDSVDGPEGVDDLKNHVRKLQTRINHLEAIMGRTDHSGEDMES